MYNQFKILNMKVSVSGITLECVQGNIVFQPDITAVVNAANANLRIGGGVAGAIHRAAGPELEEECRPLAPIKPGETVITSAYDLPNKFVIHCLGPIYGVDEPENVLLSNCYRNALTLADQHKIDSIAFPAISTGAFGYPIKKATGITIKTILEKVPNLEHVKKIRFVLFSKHDYEIYVQELKEQLNND